MKWLFDYQSFMPRYSCGDWDSWLIGANQISNFAIFLSYTLISVYIACVWYKHRYSVLNHWILLFFTAFISLCGLTHLCNFISFYVAPYRLFTLIDSLTAVVSIVTCYFLLTLKYSFNNLQSYVNLTNDLEKEIMVRKEMENLLMLELQRKARKRRVLTNILEAQEIIPQKAKLELEALLRDLEYEGVK